jgi:predicted DNA binding CopG/RHH family protein
VPGKPKPHLAATPGSSGALAAGTQKRISSPLERKVVRSIAKQKEPGVKRVNINLEISLHNAFKAATAAQGVDMTTVLQQFIENYVAKYGPALKQKGRRA